MKVKWFPEYARFLVVCGCGQFQWKYHEFTDRPHCASCDRLIDDQAIKQKDFLNDLKEM